MDFDELGLCFHFSRQCCLLAEFYSLNGTSIMESAVLRSGAYYGINWVLPLSQESFPAQVQTHSDHVLGMSVTTIKTSQLVTFFLTHSKRSDILVSVLKYSPSELMFHAKLLIS